MYTADASQNKWGTDIFCPVIVRGPVSPLAVHMGQTGRNVTRYSKARWGVGIT